MFALTSLVTGCVKNPIGAAAYFFSPKQIDKADFHLTQGRLAIVFETAAGEENPVFARELHTTLTRELQDRQVPSKVIPYTEMISLRQKPEYARWSVQRIGRELAADQVLYLRAERFLLRETPEYPVLTPSVTLRIKVIDPDAPANHARLWPIDDRGTELQCSRPASEASGPDAADRAAQSLARDTARLVARFFYDVDLEEKPVREP